MATKTYFFNFILIVFSTQSIAQSDYQLLLEWTKKNETYLLDKYTIINSKQFESNCLHLAKTLQLKKIKKCTLFDSEHINAYVFNNGHVYFSSAMMKLLRNNHQWASILAHESAHIELNHYLNNIKTLKNPPAFFPKSKYKKQLKKQEQQADDWAEKRLEKFDFDNSQIFYFLKRVETLTGNKRSNTHLKLSKRMKNDNIKEIISPEFGSVFE